MSHCLTCEPFFQSRWKRYTYVEDFSTVSGTILWMRSRFRALRRRISDQIGLAFMGLWMTRVPELEKQMCLPRFGTTSFIVCLMAMVRIELLLSLELHSHFHVSRFAVLTQEKRWSFYSFACLRHVNHSDIAPIIVAYHRNQFMRCQQVRSFRALSI
jgi:hypothetical protein